METEEKYHNYLIFRIAPDEFGQVSKVVIQAVSEQVARDYIASELNDWEVLERDKFGCEEYDTYEKAVEAATQDATVIESQYLPHSKMN